MCAFICGSLEYINDNSSISVYKSCAVISKISMFSYRVEFIDCNLKNFSVVLN